MVGKVRSFQQCSQWEHRFRGAEVSIEKNLELLLEDTVTKFKPNIIVVETFDNKIPNLDETMPEEDMLIEMKGKHSVLIKMTQQ